MRNGPPAMLKTAENAIAEGVDQYPPGMGIAPCARRSPRSAGATSASSTTGHQVLVTVGATEAIEATVIGLVDPAPKPSSSSRSTTPTPRHRHGRRATGDGAAGARRPRFRARRRCAASRHHPEDQGVIINWPHNPTGMVLSDDELSAVARIAGSAPDLLVITDEVYDIWSSTIAATSRRPAIRAWRSARITISSAARCSTARAGRSAGQCGAPDLIAGVRAAKQ